MEKRQNMVARMALMESLSQQHQVAKYICLKPLYNAQT